MKNISNIQISVVIPVYGCYKSLKELNKRLNQSLIQITEKFEIIIINDASPDGAWKIIQDLAKEDKRVKGINLSQNFGQHSAITAGLDNAKGKWVVVMDCDLQDQPEEIIKLYNQAQKGYDIVFGRRAERKDSFIKKIMSKAFYKIYSYFLDSDIDGTIGQFGIYSSKVINELQKLKEKNRAYAFTMFINILGFKKTAIDIAHAKRETGKSSYNFKKLINLAINNIITQSNKPLRLFVKFGFIISMLSIFYVIKIIIYYFIYGVSIEGWTSLIVSIWFLFGLVFANLGILGLYIGKIFNEVKDRPIYIIDEMTWLNQDL